MDEKYVSLEEKVAFGLNLIEPERTVEISVRDLMFVSKTLEVFVSFFHQPMHYPTLEAVEEFTGNVESGAFHLLHDCYYQKLRDVFPEDIVQKKEEGQFDHPEPPYFFAPRDN